MNASLYPHVSDREGGVCAIPRRAIGKVEFDIKHSASLKKKIDLHHVGFLKLIDGISVVVGVSITFSGTKCSLLVVNLIIVKV